MKKQSFLLLGGALLALASCQPEGTTGGFTQEQVDSIVNARVMEQMTALQASNDSTINALASMKADSIIAAMKGGKAVTTKTTTTRTTTVKNPGGTTKPTPPATTGNGKPKMTNTEDPNTTGNGKPKMTNTDPNTTGNGKPKMTNTK